MIAESSGTQFDPEVVDAFMQIPLTRLDDIRREAG
jgi:response regulator RpfG family c-di-GMP phosphodiesterase